ncbi:MAG: hypothetical protein LBC03_01280 [Nitrososphaerota archaeon]|nr:hypothetical protein [Nitrososphaerota archaeon]
MQKVIPEVSIGKFLEEGWEFKVQLQSGSVIMEKAIDVESITNTVLEQTRKQIEDTIEKTDVESITDKAMGQAIKQIEEAVVKEKQRLLKE